MVTQRSAIGEDIHVVRTQPEGLSAGQLVSLVVLGVVLWFAAALAVRAGESVGFFSSVASVFAFAVAIPVCWLSVAMVRKVTRLKAGQALPGIAFGTMIATFCDGIALTWARNLYGSDPLHTTFGAAWILWGVGLFLLFGYRADQRPAR